MGIRCAAKAIVIHQGKVLLNRCRDTRNGDYFCLPGGGQRIYESLRDAIIRECLEETGYRVEPVRFAALYEEICDDADFRENYPDYAHKLYHIFLCHLQDETRTMPSETDAMQLRSEWLDMERLNGLFLLPKAVGERFAEIVGREEPVYLGSQHILFPHG